jgi:hypothetical protein
MQATFAFMNDVEIFGAVLHRSPGPLAVIGYQYESWPHGKRKKIYETPTTQRHYDNVIRRIKRKGGTQQQMDHALFVAFMSQ